jgi:hypothetical protein
MADGINQSMTNQLPPLPWEYTGGSPWERYSAALKDSSRLGRAEYLQGWGKPQQIKEAINPIESIRNSLMKAILPSETRQLALAQHRYIMNDSGPMAHLRNLVSKSPKFTDLPTAVVTPEMISNNRAITAYPQDNDNAVLMAVTPRYLWGGIGSSGVHEGMHVAQGYHDNRQASEGLAVGLEKGLYGKDWSGSGYHHLPEFANNKDFWRGQSHGERLAQSLMRSGNIPQTEIDYVSRLFQR